MSSGTIGIILAVYALILWILLFFVWRKGYQEWKSNRADRVRTYRARVVDRREDSTPAQEPAVRYCVTFEFRGLQREFEVGAQTYAEARIGEEGILRMRGERFESFEPKSVGERTDEVLRKMMKR